MPSSVQAAVFGLMLLAGLLISIIVIVISHGGYAITEPFALALALLILLGVCRGNRLAYLWGRRIGLIGAVLNAIIAAGHVISTTADIADLDAEFHFVLAGICLTAAFAQLIVFSSLGYASAREYFGLICPQCSADQAPPADFSFHQARCGSCQQVW